MTRRVFVSLSVVTFVPPVWSFCLVQLSAKVEASFDFASVLRPLASLGLVAARES